MRLYEIIDFTPKSSTQSFSTYKDLIKKKTKFDHAGAGSYSQVYGSDSSKRLNQVTKVGRTGLVLDDDDAGVDYVEQDAYLFYLQEVYRYLKYSHNPFFPQIHDLKIFRNKETEKLSFRANIERLHPMEIFEGNEEVIKMVWNNLFGETYYLEPMLDDLTRQISVVCRQYVASNKSNAIDIKNPQMREALDVIYEIIRVSKRKIGLDLHEYNMMWRLTGTMPQLVFNDPVALFLPHNG